MRRIYIPALGDLLALAYDWTFELYAEGRNISLMEIAENVVIDSWHDFKYDVHSGEYVYKRAKYPKPFTIPAGTTLSVDRIYIRKGAKQFDSITFRVKESPDTRLLKKRFWAKLDDVNRMEVQ